MHALVNVDLFLIQTLSRVDHLVIQRDDGDARFGIVLVGTVTTIVHSGLHGEWVRLLCTSEGEKGAY